MKIGSGIRIRMLTTRLQHVPRNKKKVIMTGLFRTKGN
jgi:hypothetical protein